MPSAYLPFLPGKFLEGSRIPSDVNILQDIIRILLRTAFPALSPFTGFIRGSSFCLSLSCLLCLFHVRLGIILRQGNTPAEYIGRILGTSGGRFPVFPICLELPVVFLEFLSCILRQDGSFRYSGGKFSH